jgi:hypothetical protein
MGRHAQAKAENVQGGEAMKPRLVLTGHTQRSLYKNGIYRLFGDRLCFIVINGTAHEYRVVPMAQNNSLTQAQD